jgi:hypothetical protein
MQREIKYIILGCPLVEYVNTNFAIVSYLVQKLV